MPEFLEGLVSKGVNSTFYKSKSIESTKKETYRDGRLRAASGPSLASRKTQSRERLT